MREALEVQEFIFNGVDKMHSNPDNTFDEREAYLKVMQFLATDFWKWYRGETNG